MSETESYDEPEMLARRKETYGAFIKLSYLERRRDRDRPRADGDFLDLRSC